MLTKPFNGQERLGVKLTKEIKEKISKAKTGKKLSIKHKKNLSLSKIGKPSSALGYKWTLGQKRSLSISKSGKPKKRKNVNELKTDESKIWRNRIEYRLWREAVFARDNWTCQECNIRGDKLHPHHIKQFAYYPKLRFAIDNGKTLCIRCHKEYHKKNGNRNK